MSGATEDFSTIDLKATPRLGDALLDRFSAAREAQPIVWSETSRSWLVLRHADIIDALRGKLPLSNGRFHPSFFESIVTGPWRDAIPTIGRYVPTWITRQDGEQHMKLRLAMMKALPNAGVEAMRPYIRARVGELMDRIDADPELEFVETIARELPGRVILKMMGLSEDIYPNLRHWATTVTTGLVSNIPTAEQLRHTDRVLEEMTDAFVAVLADRRARPREDGDFITLMLRAADEGRLSEDSLVGALQLIVIAGHDTTTNSIALGLAGLARAPDQWRQLQQRPDLALNAVQEVMRLTAMSTAQNRTATEDFEWHGQSIRKGDMVYLVLAAGNRDPRVFDHPDQLDVTRNTAPTLVFGPGLHHCIGHLLAKVQLTEFFGQLTQRFDGAEVLDTDLDWLPPINFRGLGSLRVRFLRR